MLKPSLRVALLGVAFCLAAPAVASAHPLGNFSVNHLAQVRVSADRVDVRYVLDEAEIPTFQQRDTPDAAILARKQAEVRRGLVLTVDGRRVALRPAGRATIAHPARPGRAAHHTRRAPTHGPGEERPPRRVARRHLRRPRRLEGDRGRAGAGHRGALERRGPGPDQRAADLSLRGAHSPADVREARLEVEPGAGTLTAPDGERTFAGQDTNRAEREFTDVFSDAAAGEGVLLLLLLAAFGWGAVHALSPGHGKAMVAAYLVGTRGKPRHAVALGLIVTVTHTIGVFALGAITLALSQCGTVGFGRARQRGRERRQGGLGGSGRASARPGAHSHPVRSVGAPTPHSEPCRDS